MPATEGAHGSSGPSLCTRRSTCACTGCQDFKVLIANNRKWVKDVTQQDGQFFERLANIQTPKFFWVGCADSRVVANQLTGLMPGEVFVHRNVGNVAMHNDLNCMSALEYAVTALKVKHIIVCGHYNCGAVRAALKLPQKTPGLVNCWISDIRQARNENHTELQSLDDDAAFSRLCELNVVRQCFHICTSPVVQDAWSRGQELYVHGVIYAVGNGLLKRLVGPISSPTNEHAKRVPDDASIPWVSRVGATVELDPSEDPVNRLILKYQAIAALTFALGFPYAPGAAMKGWQPAHVPEEEAALEKKKGKAPAKGKGWDDEPVAGPETADMSLDSKLSKALNSHMQFEKHASGDGH